MARGGDVDVCGGQNNLDALAPPPDGMFYKDTHIVRGQNHPHILLGLLARRSAGAQSGPRSDGSSAIQLQPLPGGRSRPALAGAASRQIGAGVAVVWNVN